MGHNGLVFTSPSHNHFDSYKEISYHYLHTGINSIEEEALTHTIGLFLDTFSCCASLDYPSERKCLGQENRKINWVKCALREGEELWWQWSSGTDGQTNRSKERVEVVIYTGQTSIDHLALAFRFSAPVTAQTAGQKWQWNNIGGKTYRSSLKQIIIEKVVVILCILFVF